MQGKQLCALRFQEKGWLPLEEIDIAGLNLTKVYTIIPALQVLNQSKQEDSLHKTFLATTLFAKHQKKHILLLLFENHYIAIAFCSCFGSLFKYEWHDR